MNKKNGEIFLLLLIGCVGGNMKVRNFDNY